MLRALCDLIYLTIIFMVDSDISDAASGSDDSDSEESSNLKLGRTGSALIRIRRSLGVNNENVVYDIDVDN